MARRRVRLTERQRSAVEGPPYTPYPGTVNQPDRQFKSDDQYDDWEEVVNHPLPDMRHEWQDDSRDEIGFGIPEQNPPTVASIRAAASKAVKLAVLLLGEKVDEDVIENQARDFLRMGSEGLDRALSRFADTVDLYTAEDKGKEDEEEAAETVQEEKEEKAKKEDEKKAADEDSKDDESDESEEEEKKEAAEDKGKEEEEEAAETVQEEKEEKAKKEKEDSEAKAKEGSVAELDIELTAQGDEMSPDTETDDAQLLASLYEAGDDEDEDEEEDSDEDSDDDSEEESKEASSQGVTTIGGQPKTKKTAGVVDLKGLWGDAPDVSDVFH